MTTEWLDEDGVYPTEEALKRIEEWPWQDIPGCFAFMKDIWAYADSGYWEEEDSHDELFKNPIHKYYISTAGWSGNEDIIRALQKNHMVWIFSWYSSKRGGHYIFEVNKKKNEGS